MIQLENMKEIERVSKENIETGLHIIDLDIQIVIKEIYQLQSLKET